LPIKQKCRPAPSTPRRGERILPALQNSW